MMDKTEHTPWGRVRFLALILLTCCVSVCYAQLRQASGKVVDCETGEPLPYANVYFKQLMTGVITDPDGIFVIDIPKSQDSISFNSVGYHNISVAVRDLSFDDNRIEMVPQNFSIGEVRVRPDDAPKRLIRNVIAHKKENDPLKYDRTEYEKYTRWEYSLNNISDRAQDNFLLRSAQSLMCVDQDSVRFLPVYFTETLSHNETQKDPRRLRTTILADDTRGLDIFKQYEINGFSSAMDTEVSFYEDVIKVVGGAGFVSPIADNALQYYKFYITDSCTMADSTKVYTVKFRPRNEGDKTFVGTMDIETKRFSVQSVFAEMPKYTNINFVKKLILKSTYQFIADSLPFFGTTEMDMHVDYMPVSSDKKRLEIRCTMFNSNRNVVLNSPNPLTLSAKALAYETLRVPNYKNQDSLYWSSARHVDLPLSAAATANTIDSLNDIGHIKAVNLIGNMAITGFLDVGRFEIGPYTEMFNTNKIEALHLGCGVRTSKEISEKWVLMGVVGLGFRNWRPTYQASVGYRFASPYRRTLEAAYYDRLVRIGENENILYLYENMLTTSETNIVAQIFKRAEIDELMYERKAKLTYVHEWFTGVASKFSAEHRWQLSPKFYPFTRGGVAVEQVEQSEIAFDTRVSFREKYVDDGMQRLYLSTDYPIIHVTLAAGETRVVDQSEMYARVHSTLKHSVYFGQTLLNYTLEGGMIFGKMPYSTLEMPRGNKTYGLYDYDFNMMNYMEFVNDRYIYIYVDYFLNGRLLNNIPRFGRFGLREVVGLKAMLSALSDKHQQMLDLPAKLSGANSPYLELSLGLDNIFRFFRVDLLWRVTTNDHVDIPRVGVRLQFNFKL